MQATNTLGEMLSTLLDRRAFSWKADDSRSITDLCTALLAEHTEATGQQIAAAILGRFYELDNEEQVAFFTFLNDALDVNADDISEAAQNYGRERSTKHFKALAAVSEPKRQDLFRKLNQAPGATASLVDMRAALLKQLKSSPDLARTDDDFSHLLKSWFNRGFLVLRQITWDSPASILEKLIAYEAVHEIQNWNDLRRRLQPEDRRCFAFFHPSMPDDPLIFVEVALTKGVPNSIQNVLSDNRQSLLEGQADTAVFYSISNCQPGLAGISFGNSLIKQVARDLTRDLPNLKSFVTLSPIPGIGRWLKENEHETETDEGLTRLAATYLLTAKRPNGTPLDPVARFHLGNGAVVHQVHSKADISDKGMAQSNGLMVNYLYDLGKIPQNIEGFANQGIVAASSAVKSLAKQGAKDILQIKNRKIAK
jgi:malonyl-CoA decarboxylase